MTRFGLDSTSEVSTWAHHEAGSTVALRYLSRYTPKVVTRSEHAAYRKAHIDLVLVFEDSGRPDVGGYDGGKADAEFAVKQARDILGTPALPVCIRYAADYDPAGHPERTDAYYDGVAAVQGRAFCGPYGGIEITRRQADRGFKQIWQTYAWSGTPTQWDSRALVRQYSNDHTVGGVGVDFNHLNGADFGQYDRRPPAPPSPPTHYERFSRGPFPSKWGPLNERSVVEHYDGARKHVLRWPGHVKTLEAQCRFLADRIAHEVIADAAASGRPRNWLIYFRGWRYQQLIRRAQGVKLA